MAAEARRPGRTGAPPALSATEGGPGLPPHHPQPTGPPLLLWLQPAWHSHPDIPQAEHKTGFWGHPSLGKAARRAVPVHMAEMRLLGASGARCSQRPVTHIDPPRVLQTLGKTPSLASLNPPPHTFFLPSASQGLLGNDLPRTPQARNRFHAPCPEISGFSAPDSRVGWQRGTWLASGNLPACCSQPRACGPLLSPAHYWAWHAGVTSPGYPLRIRSTTVLDLPPIPHHPTAAAPLLSVFLPGL